MIEEKKESFNEWFGSPYYHILYKTEMIKKLNSFLAIYSTI